MIQKQFVGSGNAAKCRLTFTLPKEIWADEVFLVGSFNDWSETSHPLKETKGGDWRIVLDLPCNSVFEFRYLCDGEWLNDNAADAYRENPHGTHNSVVNTYPPSA